MTRSCFLKCLVISFLFFSCSEKNKNDNISVQWEANKAVAVFVPEKFIADVPADSVQSLLQIHLKGNNTPILGEYMIKDNGIVFRPLIPFTYDLEYEIRLSGKTIDEIVIPFPAGSYPPQVIAIYPVNDTLPENLLKFYISFSKPMREGEAVQHIHLIKNNTDTLSDVFLDLQQELWNSDRTMLTIWLDPGRIKRGLQPNKLLGPPLQRNENYQLEINKDWRGENGLSLAQHYSKIFFTIERDSVSPSTNAWTINKPAPGTRDQLHVNFHESLDHVLAENTMRISDDAGNYVKGVFHVNDKSNAVYFIPGAPWKPGKYKLEIESRLEDLAGNNLVRLFDADVNQKQQQKDIFTREFEVSLPSK